MTIRHVWIARLAVIAAIATFSHSAVFAFQQGTDVELERKVKEVSAQLRCVVCQGLSIQDSPSGLAQEMRAVVREQLAAGKTPDEVKAYFVARYGEWVLLRPKATGFNLMVYILPIALFLGGGAFIFVQARRWTRSATAVVGNSFQSPSTTEVAERAAE